MGNLYAVEKNPAEECWEKMFREAKRWKAYALSKFAVTLLAQHLNEQKGVRAVAVHPGNVRTQMADAVGKPKMRKFLFFLKNILIEPEVAAENVCFCVERDLSEFEYRHADRVQKLTPAVLKPRNKEALIRMSKQMTEKFRSWE